MNLTEDNYWSDRGRYQSLANRLADLIPPMGEVENAEQRPELERFRLAQNYYYDIFNNGAGNIVDQVEEMDDDGDYYTDYSINRWWEEYFDDIEEFAGLNMDRLRTKILGYVHWDRDAGLSELMDDYIDRIVLRVDNQSVTK